VVGALQLDGWCIATGDSGRGAFFWHMV